MTVGKVRATHLLEFYVSDTKIEDCLERTSLAVQCLATIANIDFDLIIPFIARCLPLLLQVRGIRVHVPYQFLTTQGILDTCNRTSSGLPRNSFELLYEDSNNDRFCSKTLGVTPFPERSTLRFS